MKMRTVGSTPRIYSYSVACRDIRPDGYDAFTIRVAAPTAAAARRAAERLSPLGLQLRGITLRGVLVTDKATRLSVWGRGGSR